MVEKSHSHLARPLARSFCLSTPRGKLREYKLLTVQQKGHLGPSGEANIFLALGPEIIHHMDLCKEDNDKNWDKILNVNFTNNNEKTNIYEAMSFFS